MMTLERRIELAMSNAPLLGGDAAQAALMHDGVLLETNTADYVELDDLAMIAVNQDFCAPDNAVVLDTAADLHAALRLGMISASLPARRRQISALTEHEEAHSQLWSTVGGAACRPVFLVAFRRLSGGSSFRMWDITPVTLGIAHMTKLALGTTYLPSTATDGDVEGLKRSLGYTPGALRTKVLAQNAASHDSVLPVPPHPARIKLARALRG